LLTEEQKQNEQFFQNYRLYDQLINLRLKWSFLSPALTTCYYPAKKEFSMDKVLTFLEFRHDRILENYQNHLLAIQEEKQPGALQTKCNLVDLLKGLSFIRHPPKLRHDSDENFHFFDRIKLVAVAETSENDDDSLDEITKATTTCQQNEQQTELDLEEDKNHHHHHHHYEQEQHHQHHHLQQQQQQQQRQQQYQENVISSTGRDVQTEEWLYLEENIAKKKY